MPATKEEATRYVPPCHSAASVDTPVLSDWTRFLPSPYDSNPPVVVYMVPIDSQLIVRDTLLEQYKGVQCLFAEFVKPDPQTGEPVEFKIPMCFTGQDHGNFIMHKKLINEMGGKFGNTAFQGRLAEIPTVCLMREDYKPVVVLFDQPHADLLDLTKYMTNLTKAANNNG